MAVLREGNRIIAQDITEIKFFNPLLSSNELGIIVRHGYIDEQFIVKKQPYIRIECNGEVTDTAKIRGDATVIGDVQEAHVKNIAYVDGKVKIGQCICTNNQIEEDSSIQVIYGPELRKKNNPNIELPRAKVYKIDGDIEILKVDVTDIETVFLNKVHYIVSLHDVQVKGNIGKCRAIRGIKVTNK